MFVVKDKYIVIVFVIVLRNLSLSVCLLGD